MTSTEPFGSEFERELHEQPDALERLLARGRAPVEAIAERIRAFKPRFVVIAARGSSDNAARYANYLFGVHHGLATALASPSLVTRYHARLQLSESLVLGISQSGQSPDIVSMVGHARDQGALTVTLTNDLDSPLAEASDACVSLEAGEERAVAASKTYTNEVAGLAMLSAALRGEDAPWRELDRLPDAVRRTIALSADIRERVLPFDTMPGFAVIGRGFNISTAHEIALKTMEMTYILAQPFALPDFMHGPVAMLNRRLPVMAIATAGPMIADMMAFLDVVRARGSPLVAISDREEVLSSVDVPLRVADGVPEWLSPVTAIVPGQFWAMAIAYRQGLSPDQPVGLSKVTETE